MTAKEVEQCLTVDRRFLTLPHKRSACVPPTIVAAAQKGQLPTPTARRHCIVTPDFIGPIKNGGIGTACYHLARFLRQEKGHHVSVLFTGPVEEGTPKHWRTHYADNHGLVFYTLDDCPQLSKVPHHNLFTYQARSFRIDRWLRTQSFDAIHFQDWQANGFVPVQAKRQGLAYEDSLLTCTIHSPQQWINEGAHCFPSEVIEDILQNYNERYAACHADVAVFPSRHMLDWTKRNLWNVRRPLVVPNLWTSESSPNSSDARQPVTELCFFGRWETRKGLEVFTAALARLRDRLGCRAMPLVSFLGKPGQAAGGPARAHLDATAARLGIDFILIDNLDSNNALDYMASRPGCIAVVPSLCDNLPYAVIECLQRKIPILASARGGIPELVSSPEHLFEPEPASLAGALAHSINEGIAPAISAYSPEEAAQKWHCLAEEPPPPSAKRREVGPQDVTVCIAHYNHGDFLPEALESISLQTTQGFHVVVVDDGSNDPQSVKVFEEMQQKWTSNTTWRFVRTANSGVGSARNNAVQHSTTPFVVFLDADNVAAPRMIEVMVAAMANSGADCLTCYMEGFSTDSQNRKKLIYRYLPTGACVEAGAIINIFGDANCIIDKEAFMKVGGFSPNRSASFEDWELFARLCLSGKTLDVIPAFLHYYRHLESGFSRTTSSYLNHRRIRDTYVEHGPAWVAPILDIITSTHLKATTPGCIETPLAPRDSAVLAEIYALRSSKSWRITAPLRRLGDARMAFKVRDTSNKYDSCTDEELALYLQELRASTSLRVTAPLRKWAKFFRRGDS